MASGKTYSFFLTRLGFFLPDPAPAGHAICAPAYALPVSVANKIHQAQLDNTRQSAARCIGRAVAGALPFARFTLERSEGLRQASIVPGCRAGFRAVCIGIGGRIMDEGRGGIMELTAVFKKLPLGQGPVVRSEQPERRHLKRQD